MSDKKPDLQAALETVVASAKEHLLLLMESEDGYLYAREQPPPTTINNLRSRIRRDADALAALDGAVVLDKETWRVVRDAAVEHLTCLSRTIMTKDGPQEFDTEERKRIIRALAASPHNFVTTEGVRALKDLAAHPLEPKEGEHD